MNIKQCRAYLYWFQYFFNKVVLFLSISSIIHRSMEKLSMTKTIEKIGTRHIRVLKRLLFYRNVEFSMMLRL